MNPNREEALFAAALEQPSAERAAFLNGACLGDDALLASHDATLNPLATQAETARPTVKIEFSDAPDELVAAAVDGGGFLRFWNLTLEPEDAFKGFLGGAHSVIYSPDGRRLAASSNGMEAVKLWDAETRQELLTLSGQGSLFFGLQFSPDGRLLLAVNGDGLVQLWSVPSGEEIAAAETEEKADLRQP